MSINCLFCSHSENFSSNKFCLLFPSTSCIILSVSNPYFEIEHNGDFDNIAEILNADNEPKAFFRRRAFAPFRVADDKDVMGVFDAKKSKHSEGTLFQAMLLSGVAFALLIAMSVLFIVTARTPEEIIGYTAVFIATAAFGAVFIVCAVCHFSEHAFVNSTDELFILYDREGVPCSVEISDKRVRVLYKDTLYVIKNSKVKPVANERKIYYAYLNMFPLSTLHMSRYTDNSDKTSYVAPMTPSVTYLPDGTVRLSFGPYKTLTLGDHSTSILRGAQHVHFSKYIFEVNADMKLSAVYSGARESVTKSYHVMTYARVTERSERAMDKLNRIVRSNEKLAEVLKNTSMPI